MLYYEKMILFMKRLFLSGRYIHSSALREKAGFYKVTLKGDYPLTYEQAQPPYRIGVTKSWNSWNSC